MKNIKIPILVASVFFNTSCASFIDDIEVKPDGENFYMLKHPYERFQNPDVFFKKEYRQINKRRRSDKIYERPLNLVGLSLSGGGIRSGAFQLGLLSGLHSGEYNNSSILKRIDYISSVSGGGWANGAYWAWDKTDDDLFLCLNSAAENGTDNAVKNECSENTVSMLRHYQGVKIIPYDAKEKWFEQRKETWESDIVKYYLSPDRNIDFSEFKWEGRFENKYYPIFNSTHDAVSRSGKFVNLPFETTPDYLGTIIDLESEDKNGNTFCDKGLKNNNIENKIKNEIKEECPKSKMGFFAIQNSSDFSWWNRKWQRYWKFWDSNPDLPGATLSKVMAHSSAVVGKDLQFALAYNFDLRYQGKYVSNLREFYQMVDGGKSDNLGLIPLIERQLDLIVVSHMGKDAVPFEDFHLASKQVKKLFNCKLNLDGDQEGLVIKGSYSCPGNQNGIMIHVKPTYANVEGFKLALSEDRVCQTNSKCKEVIEYLTGDSESKLDKKDRFPQSKTFDFSYDEKLIRAYYLLGRYIAKMELNDVIDKYLVKLKD